MSLKKFYVSFGGDHLHRFVERHATGEIKGDFVFNYSTLAEIEIEADADPRSASLLAFGPRFSMEYDAHQMDTDRIKMHFPAGIVPVPKSRYLTSDGKLISISDLVKLAAYFGNNEGHVMDRIWAAYTIMTKGRANRPTLPDWCQEKIREIPARAD